MSPEYTLAAAQQHPVLASALYYASLGWCVLPVYMDTKKPRITGWQNRATTDPAQITHWFTDWPTAGIGIATGKMSGFFVIDVDQGEGKDGEASLRKMEAELGALPHALQQRTPSGGRHILFRYDNLIPVGSSAGIERAIDVRRDGGYIVVPPGARGLGAYEWQDGCDPCKLAEAPAAWTKRLAERRKTARALRREGAPVGGVQEGQRNTRLASHLGRLRREGWEEDPMREEAARWNDQNCDPPLDAEEVQRTVQSILRYDPASASELTELGNGKRLAEAYANDIRFTPELGWMVWNGKNWQEDKKELLLTRFSSQIPERIRQEANLATSLVGQESLRKWARASQTKARIKAAIVLAASIEGISESFERFDQQPTLLAVENGVIDLKNGTFRDPSPEDYITHVAPVRYDPTARAPVWEKVLNRIFAKDAALIGFLQRSAGYWATGLNVHALIWLLYGTGRNGKGVFMNTLSEILGPHVVSSPRETFVLKRNGGGIPNDIARLRGTRICVCNEFPEDRPPDQDLMKQISGGDKLSARFLHKEFADFTATSKLVIVTNNRIVFSSHNDAMWSRLVEIPFTVRIPDEEQDVHLKSKLLDEASGILNWIIAGARGYFKDGLVIPTSVRAATAEARNEIDTVGAFVSEQIRSEKGEKIGASRLYSTYSTWCKLCGRDSVKMATFKKELTSRFHYIQERSSSGQIWRDLAVLDL